jgi:F-type H+-transporting ATPase subunit b
LRRVLLIPLILVAGAMLAQEHPQQTAGRKTEGGEHTAAPEPDLTLWKWANFAILAGVLGFFIAKNAGPFFASRTAEIRRGIDEAREMRADAEARAAQMDKMIASLGEEIENLRKTAQAEAAAQGERVREETQREIAKIQAHAEQAIASALKAAQAGLKSHAANLAVELAARKVQDRITAQDQDALVRVFAAHVKQVQ